MTTRKPPNISFRTWVERQIATAEAEQPFATLPGAGEPIPGIERPRGELDWVATYLRREEVEVAALLPPALALAKEVETLPERLARVRSEARARGLVEDLNARIRSAQLAPQDGPPFRVRTVNVDNVLADWRAAEAARAAARASAPPPPPPVEPQRRRWFRRAR